jgi:hypothetical protein
MTPINYAKRHASRLSVSDYLAVAALPIALPVGLHYGLELLRVWLG